MKSLIKFGTVGMIGFAIDISATYLLKNKLNINLYISNAVGFALAVSNNYYINKYWTFEGKKDANINQFLKFIAISLIGLLLNSTLIYYFINFINLDFYYSKVLAIFLVFAWNFTLSKFVVFNVGNQKNFFNIITSGLRKRQ